jgi:membrane protein DedA with SNARE-associated domain
MKTGPLVAAVVLAVFLLVRRRKLEPTLLIGGVIAVIGLAIYGAGLVELPNVEKLLTDAGDALGAWTYAVVAAAAFLETGAFVGLVAPGETIMVFGGVVAGQGKVNIIALIALVWAAAVAGDVTSYYLGRRLGRDFLVKHGPKVQITEERLHKVEGFFDKHGGKTILIGRFVGLVRAIAPFLAGSSGMPLRRFLPYDVIGAGAWATTFLLLGYIFWRRFADVLDYAHKGASWLAATIVVVVAVVLLVRLIRSPERRAQAGRWIDEQLDRPVLRPLGAVLRPLWQRTRAQRRFLLDRVRPGTLGLEFTTLGAIASVGSFIYIGYLVVLQDTVTTPGDRRGLRWADALNSPALTSIAKVVTALGSLPVAGGVVAIAATVLATRRRLLEAATLVVAMVLVYAGVHLTKDATDRPRPSGPLIDTDLSAYPSGHSAYAVAWVAVAVVLTRTLPSLARATALVVAACVLVLLVAASRVYLRVHYLSDVLGGIGMASMIFALCGMAALVVARVRHNGARL